MPPLAIEPAQDRLLTYGNESCIQGDARTPRFSWGVYRFCSFIRFLWRRGRLGHAPSVSAASVTISGAPITFNSQPVGTASPPRTVTLTNSGTATLNIASVKVAGPHAADFVLTNTCGSRLAPGASCTATVTFKPSAAGNRTASVNITDDAAGSPHIIPVSGTGIASAFTLSAASLDFGSQLVGAPSAAQTETVTNSGAANLTVSTVTIGGANPSDFAISKDTCAGATVAPSGACVVGVTFTPAVSGTRNASLTFSDNAAGSPQSVSLSGVGNNPPPSAQQFLARLLDGGGGGADPHPPVGATS